MIHNIDDADIHDVIWKIVFQRKENASFHVLEMGESIMSVLPINPNLIDVVDVQKLQSKIFQKIRKIA